MHWLFYFCMFCFLKMLRFMNYFAFLKKVRNIVSECWTFFNLNFLIFFFEWSEVDMFAKTHECMYVCMDVCVMMNDVLKFFKILLQIRKNIKFSSRKVHRVFGRRRWHLQAFVRHRRCFPHGRMLHRFWRLTKKINLFTAKFYDLDAILIVFSSKFERNNLLIFSHFLYCWLVEPWWQAWPRWDYRHAREDSGYWLCFRMRRDQAQTIRGGWRKLPHKHFIKKINNILNSEVARDAILIFNFCFYVNFSSTKS